ncbi:MAG: O-antigen ligase family protein [Pseudorhodoplanes sp.]|uniref:O-antigen ligase family protein n=1 Tax=Pseudorhodoplanes sp. TaxID=1934341 RepID=UPI003D0E4621
MLVALLLFQMVSMSLTSVLFAAHPQVILAAFLVTAIPFSATLLLHAERVRLLSLLIWAGIIFLALCFGYLFNPLSIEPAARVLVVFLVFAFGWASAIMIRPSAIAQSMLVAGAAGLIATAIQLYREGLSGYFEEGERLTGGDESHPNLVGLTMVCVALCGSSASNLLVRYAFWVASFAISSMVQSRNAMMALLIILAVYLWRDVARRLNAAGVGVVVLLATIGLAFSLEPLLEAFSDLFQLDNPYRGTNSNLVGRAELWQATWNLFTDYPIFGFGLGQHQIGAGIDMYAHNMYLILLSEGGQVGFIAFVAATAIALRGLFTDGRDSGQDASRLVFALSLTVVTYYVYGIFEGRAVNAGNFLSYLFFFAWGYGICCFDRARNSAPFRVRDMQAQ